MAAAAHLCSQFPVLAGKYFPMILAVNADFVIPIFIY